jgi:hypothetical protein
MHFNYELKKIMTVLGQLISRTCIRCSICLEQIPDEMSDPSLGKLITNQTKTNWYPA